MCVELIVQQYLLEKAPYGGRKTEKIGLAYYLCHGRRQKADSVCFDE